LFLFLFQIADGLRQLNETYFKYHQGTLEMYDRLLFLVVQNKSEPLPSVVHLPKIVQTSKTSFNSLSSNSLSGRLKRAPIPPATGAHEKIDYKMLVTDEITQLLNLNAHRQDKKRNLFKSSLHFM